MDFMTLKLYVYETKGAIYIIYPFILNKAEYIFEI